MKIILTGDWHVGLQGGLDPDIIYDLAGSHWAGKPILIIGDLVDCGLHKGMQFSQTMQPQEQINTVDRILEIMDVKAYVLGNHDLRFFKEVGLNPFYHRLGKPKREVVVDNTSFYLFHGRSYAENIFLEHSKLMKFIYADVIAAGHNHALAKQDVLQNGRRVVWLRTGSFVKEATYAADAGLAPRIAGYCEYDTYRCIARLFRVSDEGQVQEI